MKHLKVTIEADAADAHSCWVLEPVKSDEETSVVVAMREATTKAKESGRPCVIRWHSGRRNIITPPKKKS